MANPRPQLPPSSAKSSARTTATLTRWEQSIQDIRDFHDIGWMSLMQFPDRMKYGEMSKHANAFNLNPELLRKARVFADRKQGYTPKELNTLCKLIKDHGIDAGRPVSHVHVLRFMSIRDKRVRAAFQYAAIVGHWTIHKINAEIRINFGRPRNWDAGHKPRSAESPKVACYDLLRLTQQWLRACKALRQTKGADGQEGPIRKDLPLSVREHVEAVDTAVAQLHEALLRRVPE